MFSSMLVIVMLLFAVSIDVDSMVRTKPEQKISFTFIGGAFCCWLSTQNRERWADYRFGVRLVLVTSETLGFRFSVSPTTLMFLIIAPYPMFHKFRLSSTVNVIERLFSARNNVSLSSFRISFTWSYLELQVYGYLWPPLSLT